MSFSQVGKYYAEFLQQRNFKTFRTGDKIKVKDIEVEPIHIDHSIPGAYGFLVHTAGTIVYSGDLRLYGLRKDMTEDFIEAARAARPIVMMLEGTNIDNRMGSLTEEQVFKIISTGAISDEGMCKQKDGQ